MSKNKTSHIFLSVALSVFMLHPAWGQPQTLQTGKWIKNWLLLGPVPLQESAGTVSHLPGFEKDYLSKYGGEQSPKVIPGKMVRAGKTKLKWTEYTSPDSIINLDEAVSKASFVLAYAYTEIDVDKDGTYILALGTNDGGRLWVNGEEVWDYPGARGVQPDQDLIPVVLKKGMNTILLKVEERGNNWGFCARFLPFDLNTFKKHGKIFHVVTLDNGIPELRFGLNKSVAANLFETVQLELYNDRDDEKPVWAGAWNQQAKDKLPVPDLSYRPYQLRIRATGKDGSLWTDEIPFFAGKKIDYSLFDKGKTEYNIILGPGASESEQWAARELQKYLREMSDAEFTITGDDVPVSEHEIIIGYNQHAKELLCECQEEPDSSDESFTYQNVKSHIVLLGGKQRGTMYAVFSFLENELGVRWYTPEVTVVPEREKYVFDYLYLTEKPSIRVRNDFYYEAFDPDWAAHNKINGAMGTRKQHGGVEGYWAVHTFYQFMPPSEFYKKHPEYYSLIDGKRVYDHAQLCLTNPDVLDIVTERLKKTIRENPGNLIYSVSQNDWRNPCQCDQCQAIVKREGSESGPVVWFVNQVADRIKDEFPDKYVGTLAYQYTRKPPKHIKPRENVVIRLCSIECCFAHSFESGPENRAFLSDLKRWSDISPHLYIWDYVVNFSHYIMPFPNFAVLQPNIQTLRDNSSIGIMEQGAYQSRGAEFAELRAYVIAKLLWNAESDFDAIVDDFMYGYYGRSGQFVRQYFDLLQDQVRPDTHIHLGLKPSDKIFTDKFIRKADEIFDRAGAVADNETIRRRVELARLSLMYLKCKRDPVNSKYDGTLDWFNRIVKREGITHFAEAGKPQMEDFYRQMEQAK